MRSAQAVRRPGSFSFVEAPVSDSLMCKALNMRPQSQIVSGGALKSGGASRCNRIECQDLQTLPEQADDMTSEES